MSSKSPPALQSTLQESSPPPSSFSEKRSYQRYRLWFPVTLTTEDREIWAICRDASAGGIQVSSVLPLTRGTRVKARFRVSATDTRGRNVRAEIIRSESNDGELLLAFPFRLGLRFEHPLPELPEELAQHAGLEAKS